MEKAKKAAKCEAEIQSLQSKVTFLNTKLDQIYMDRLNGLLPEEDFHRIYQKVKMDRTVLEDSLKNLQNQMEQPVSAEEKARLLVKQFLDAVLTSMELLFIALYALPYVKSIAPFIFNCNYSSCWVVVLQ